MVKVYPCMHTLVVCLVCKPALSDLLPMLMRLVQASAVALRRSTQKALVLSCGVIQAVTAGCDSTASLHSLSAQHKCLECCNTGKAEGCPRIKANVYGHLLYAGQSVWDPVA